MGCPTIECVNQSMMIATHLGYKIKKPITFGQFKNDARNAVSDKKWAIDDYYSWKPHDFIGTIEYITSYGFGKGLHITDSSKGEI